MLNILEWYHFVFDQHHWEILQIQLHQLCVALDSSRNFLASPLPIHDEVLRVLCWEVQHLGQLIFQEGIEGAELFFSNRADHIPILKVVEVCWRLLLVQSGQTIYNVLNRKMFASKLYQCFREVIIACILSQTHNSFV